MTWLASGGVAFLVANFVPHARPQRRWLELPLALIAALLFGALATALDFGGWREPDPRAAAFAFAGTMALLGIVRLTRIIRTA